MKLPHQVFVLSRFPDVLDQTSVVKVRTVEPNAERLSSLHRSGTERFNYFPRPLTPVAGRKRGQRQKQGKEVQGKRQRGSPSPINPHFTDEDRGHKLIL